MKRSFEEYLAIIGEIVFIGACLYIAARLPDEMLTSEEEEDALD